MAGRNDNRIPILVLAVACVAASALVASPRVCLAQESGSTITGLDSGTSDFGGSSVNFAADASSVKALKLNPTHPPSKGGAGALSSIYARNTAEARAIIAQALRSSREPVKPADSAVAKGLVEDMASGDTSRKETAEHRLTELGESAITPLVQMAKGDQPPAQRTATLKLLTLIGPAAAGPMATLLRHPSKDVRREVAEALAAMGDRLCLDPLCAAATDTDSDVRMAAVNGLGRLHQTMAAIVLGKMLAKEPVIEIRIAAAKSLGQVGSRAAIEPLIDALADRDVRVRLASARALTSMCDVLATGTRGQIACTKACDALLTALADKDVTVRVTAAEALGTLKDRRAVDGLAALLKDPEVRPAVIKALTHIGGGEARAQLEKFAGEAQDENARRAAAAAAQDLRKD
jgi:HEAT repeat protein